MTNTNRHRKTMKYMVSNTFFTLEELKLLNCFYGLKERIKALQQCAEEQCLSNTRAKEIKRSAINKLIANFGERKVRRTAKGINGKVI